MSESSHNYEFSASKCHLKIIGDTYALYFLELDLRPPFLSIILKSFHVVIIFKRRIECSGQEFINLHAYQYIPIDIDISELIAIRSEKVRSRNQVHVFHHG